MANGKDYYNILGVSKTASAEEIKKAYRKLAREHHPDAVGAGDKEAAEKRFKEINEAYRVLGDPEKRKTFDTYGTADPNMGGFGQGQRPGAGGQWGPFNYSYTSNGGANGAGQDFGDFDPFDIFEEFFGFRGAGGRRAPHKGKSLYYELNVEFAEAIFGAEKEINVESGKFTVKIPQGARDGLELKFPGRGMPGPQGTVTGDLFLTLRIKKPQQFNISGDNLVVTKELDFATAALGGVIEVPVIDLEQKTGIGSAKLKIPAGTDYGARFIIRSKGMPRLQSKGQGDVLVQVAVVTPKKLNRKQKELLEEFLKN